MPPRPGEPLTKVTLNLYTHDIATLKKHYRLDFSVKIRALVRSHVQELVRKELLLAMGGDDE